MSDRYDTDTYTRAIEALSEQVHARNLAIAALRSENKRLARDYEAALRAYLALLEGGGYEHLH